MTLLRLARIALTAVALSCGWMAAACSSDPASGDSTNDADAVAGDAGTSSDAAPKVTIIRPTPNQQFATTDKIPLEGTGIDAVEGDIGKAADAQQRMIWGVLDGPDVNPAGEGPSDAIGAGTDHPIDAGTYRIRLSVTNKRGLTGTADVTILVQ